MRWTATVATFAFGLVVGSVGAVQTRPSEGREMERVTGIGGVFFKSKDPKALSAWYQDHLGLAVRGGGPEVPIFAWRERDDPARLGHTVWALFGQDTEYFAPSQAPFMLNYRVRNLDRMVAQLRAHGVSVEDKIAVEFNGRFTWLMDPEGNRIELWEPKEGY